MESFSKTDIPTQAHLDFYRTMLVIRKCEEQLAKAHQRGLVQGACHTYVGEEAIATGVCAHLRNNDVVFSTHRGHGHALAKGVEPRELIAELFGRQTGVSRGRGGSMHLFSPEVGMMGTTGIVGPCILQAAGAGYGFKVQQTDRVAVAFFGDGAVNNGAFHEGLNLASIWQLPVLFVCENNQYATEVPFSYSSCNPSVGGRGPAYGMPGLELDGNNVLSIYEAAGEAVERARSGGGPTLLECKTYRTRAHAEGMGDFGYRTREDVENWKKNRDPIALLKHAVLERAICEVTELEAIENEVRAQIEAAQEFAEASGFPDPATASTHIFDESGESGMVRLLDEGSARDSKRMREITYMQATHEALSEEMAANDKIYVMGEGIGKRGGNFNTTMGLYDKYGPVRLCDTPISERGFVGMATGAAITGARPVVDFMFADFILDAMGEIINQIAKMQYMSSGRLKMPVLLRGCIGIGHSAATHHSGNYYSMYAQIPGLRVVLPSTPFDAKGLMKKSLRTGDPVMFLEHRELLTVKGMVPEEEYEIDFGKAAVVRAGSDLTVVALARMVHECSGLAEELAGDGLSVEVVDPRCVFPLDVDTILKSVNKTGRLLIVEEAYGPCNLGAEIAAQIAERGFDDLDAPIKRLNGTHTPTPYSPSLEQAVIPQRADISKAIRELMAE
ncbi:MAG: dehydrogenase [Planctomycetaceae bacterium]|nr:dehydrogenase [Planctomycetaceae bacterium]MBP61197.1 dehydrogenase [Planctomycetaceae bacterium]